MAARSTTPRTTPRTTERPAVRPGSGRPGGTAPGSGTGRRPLVLVAVVALVVGALLGALVTGLTGVSGRPGTTPGAAVSAEPEPGSVEAIAAELAEGQRQDRVELATALADGGRTAQPLLGQVLAGLAAVVPPEGTPDPSSAPGPDEVAAWTAALDEAGAALSATGTGTDDQNLTRGALLGSVALLRAAVEGVERAGEDPAAADVLAAAARDRDQAVELWQAGAARLDGLVLEGGGDEHVHLFLAPDGDPDSVPMEFRDHPED